MIYCYHVSIICGSESQNADPKTGEVDRLGVEKNNNNCNQKTVIKIWECALSRLARGHPALFRTRHFSFSAPSVICVLYVKRSILSPKWILNGLQGKARKVTKGVIETQVDQKRKARKRDEMKTRDCGWKRSITMQARNVWFLC